MREPVSGSMVVTLMRTDAVTDEHGCALCSFCQKTIKCDSVGLDTCPVVGPVSLVIILITASLTSRTQVMAPERKNVSCVHMRLAGTQLKRRAPGTRTEGRWQMGGQSRLTVHNSARTRMQCQIPSTTAGLATRSGFCKQMTQLRRLEFESAKDASACAYAGRT